MKTKKVYHLSFSEVKNNLFIPRIPDIRLSGENDDILRICFSETIEGCISAMPNGVGAIKGLLDLRETEIAFNGAYLYEIDLRDIKQENILTPDELQNKRLVPDAIHTGEYWIINQKVKCKKAKLIQVRDITTMIKFLNETTKLELIKNLDYLVLDESFDDFSTVHVIYSKKYFYKLNKWCKNNGSKLYFEKHDSSYFCRFDIKKGNTREFFKLITENYWYFMNKGTQKNLGKVFSRNTILYTNYQRIENK